MREDGKSTGLSATRDKQELIDENKMKMMIKIKYTPSQQLSEGSSQIFCNKLLEIPCPDESL